MRSLLAHVMHGRDWTPTEEVLQLLLDAGCPNRDAARQMLWQHRVRRAVERQGSPRAYSWRLVNRDGTAPAPQRVRNREGTSCMTLAEPAIDYVGPVFDRDAPLAPSLGTHCSEVMPPEIGHLIDRLHARFYREAHGVE